MEGGKKGRFYLYCSHPLFRNVNGLGTAESKPYFLKLCIVWVNSGHIFLIYYYVFLFYVLKETTDPSIITHV